MINYDSAIKQNKLVYKFTCEANSDKLSHAYLIVNDDATTLTAILNVLTRVIMCDSKCACDRCNNCLRILHNNHANIHHYGGKDAKTINVDVVEELIDTMNHTALEDGYSVYIIDGADKMNEHAQNKLLKTLEEPNADSILLLGSTNENALLPTVKSRVKQLNINIWDESAVRATLQQEYADNLDQDRLDFAAEMSAGSIERGIELMDNEEYLTRFHSLNDLLLSLQNSSQIFNYLGVLGGDSKAISLSLSMLEVIFNQALKSHIGGAPNAIAKVYSYKAIVNIQELIIEQYRKLKANCQGNSIEDSLLMGILELKYKTN